MRNALQIYPFSLTDEGTNGSDTMRTQWPSSRARLRTLDRTTPRPTRRFRVSIPPSLWRGRAIDGVALGQTLFTKGSPESLANMDKQIFRLIGKATTMAAMAYRVRQGRAFVTPPTGLSYTGS